MILQAAEARRGDRVASSQALHEPAPRLWGRGTGGEGSLALSVASHPGPLSSFKAKPGSP